MQAKKAPDNALLSIDLKTHLLLLNEHFPVLVNSLGKIPYYH